MTPPTEDEFHALVYRACDWAEKQERQILYLGVPLDEAQQADARAVGVKHVERVRLLKVPQIRLPDDSLRAALPNGAKRGLTAWYGIFIAAECWGQRWLVVHELAHVMQYQRLCGLDEHPLNERSRRFEAFLRPYLREVFFPPCYPNGPLEREAKTIERHLCPEGDR